MSAAAAVSKVSEAGHTACMRGSLRHRPHCDHRQLVFLVLISTFTAGLGKLGVYLF